MEKMSIAEKFKQFEASFDLSEFTIGDFWYYPLVKAAIYFELVGRKGTGKAANESGRSAIAQIWRQFWTGIKWKLKSASLRPAKYLFVDYALTKRQTEHGHYENIYTAPLIKALEGKAKLLFEYPAPEFGHHVGLGQDTVYFPDWDIFRIFLKARFKRKKWISADSHPIKTLYQRFGLTFDADFINDRLNKTFLFIEYFKKLLGKIGPQIVLLIDGYDYKQMALIAAAKRLAIPTVELQHGLINESHMAYMYAAVKEHRLFADYLFTFGPYFSDLIKRYSVVWQASQLVPVGFPYLETVKERSLMLPERLRNLAERFKIIYVTSQWTVRDQLRDFVLRLSKELDDTYRIFYKIHPGETDAQRFYEPFKGNEKIELILDKTVNSLEIMKIAFVHSTVYSTSYFESVFFERPNIFIEVPQYRQHIENYVDNETTFLAKNVKDYLFYLVKIGNDSFLTQKLVNRRATFYVPNALNNMLTAINTILISTKNLSRVRKL